MKNLSYSHIKQKKINNGVTFLHSSKDKTKLSDALTKTTCSDSNRTTIIHNTNLNNLNVYFLYSTGKLVDENQTKNNKKKFLTASSKEPEDSVRNRIFDLNSPIIKDKRLNSKEIKILRNISIKQAIISKDIQKSLFKSKADKYLFKRNVLYKKTRNTRALILADKCQSSYNSTKIEPVGKLNLTDFIQIKQIGKGTFGKIFSVIWKKNGKKYALKKEIFNELEYAEKRENVSKTIIRFLEKTKYKGIIQIYSYLCEKKDKEYNYYELMEMGERDLDRAINIRRKYNTFYTEEELINISTQLIRTLSLLQKNHISHRDIKPQNILIIKGQYKLCDFGEIRNMKRDGVVVQRIRGSELFMSPILFYGLRSNSLMIKHNTYKSDVFSLGMCLLYASTIYFNCIDEIRETTEMKKINAILNKYLGKRYSNKFISLIYLMLQIDEKIRPDFIQLEEKINSIF